jgi:hypothetical protein
MHGYSTAVRVAVRIVSAWIIIRSNLGLGVVIRHGIVLIYLANALLVLNTATIQRSHALSGCSLTYSDTYDDTLELRRPLLSSPLTHEREPTASSCFASVES